MEKEEGVAEKIDRILRKNLATAHVVTSRTPLEELIAQEDGAEDPEFEMEVRITTFGKLLDFLFQHGPHPLELLRMLYAIVKVLRPHLIADMSLEDLAVLCGDGGKATVSARIERIYNAPRDMRKAGHGELRASFQKTGNYSEPQKGNTNRRRKKKKI